MIPSFDAQNELLQRHSSPVASVVGEDEASPAVARHGWPSSWRWRRALETFFLLGRRWVRWWKKSFAWLSQILSWQDAQSCRNHYWGVRACDRVCKSRGPSETGPSVELVHMKSALTTAQGETEKALGQFALVQKMSDGMKTDLRNECSATKVGLETGMDALFDKRMTTKRTLDHIGWTKSESVQEFLGERDIASARLHKGFSAFHCGFKAQEVRKDKIANILTDVYKTLRACSCHSSVPSSSRYVRTVKEN